MLVLQVVPNRVVIRDQIIIDPPAELVAAIRPCVLLNNAPLHYASSGKADVLIQCAHGPCQRYIPVDQKSKCCYYCDDTDRDAIWLDDNGDDECIDCYRCKDAGQRFQNQ